VSRSAGIGAWVAGVDGCRGGWVVVLRERTTGTLLGRAVADFAAVLALRERPQVIGVDVPIGLPAVASAGGRACEVLARRLLRARASSIFSSPARPALEAFRAGASYREVSRANRAGGAPGISRQTFNILAKIDEVDRVLPAPRRTVVEVHPELSFCEANGGIPMLGPKRTRSGRAQREALLDRLGYRAALAGVDAHAARGARVEDLLDACIACWTAERVAAGAAVVIPGAPPSDARGLRMELWR
jgi:predicted RNase H-like nuclease